MTRRAIDSLTEAQWQRQLVDLAALLGYQWVHFRPGLTRAGRWAVAVQGTLGVGFPDLVLVHPTKGRVLFVELKTDTGRVDPDQSRVHDILRAAGAEVYLWRPRDLDSALAVLEGRSTEAIA